MHKVDSMLRALFDERRRDEIRQALKSGNQIVFRGRVPALEPATGDQVEELISRIGEEEKKAFFKAMGKPIESATFVELVKFIYGDYPKGSPVTYDDITRSLKPPVIVKGRWGVPRKDGGGKG